MSVQMSHQEFVRLIKATHGKTINVVGKYKNSHERIKVQCTQCSRKWEPVAYSLRNGHGCAPCKGGGKLWTHQQYVKKLKEIYEGRIRPKESYKGSTTPILHRCHEGHTWNSSTPVSLLRGMGCPKCKSTRLYPKKDKVKQNGTYAEFEYKARGLTNKVAKTYQDLVNPKNRERGRTAYVLDHRYSLHDAYYNPKELSSPIRLEEVCHPANLRMINCTKNSKKNKSSSLTASELRRRIRAWNKEHGKPFKVYRGVLTLDA